MECIYVRSIICISLFFLIGCNQQTKTDTNEDHVLFDPQKLGTVDFQCSCKSVKDELNHGVALMHHMMYTEANQVFDSVINKDSTCAMGYWARAMGIIHPLWPDLPTDAENNLAASLLNKTEQLQKTEREQLYIDAVKAYFAPPENRTVGERLTSFYEGWKSVYKAYPDDPEATAFYALASLTMVDFGIGDIEQEKQFALQSMQKLLAKIPDHPGGHHYTIHAYDYVAPDDWAVKVARNYGKIAPEVPHALHMPTHVFNTLGLWKESIAMNERSARAAYVQGRLNQGLDNHYPHALAYYVYGCLQIADDSKAQDLVREAAEISGPYSSLMRIVMAAHLTGIPARYALERHAWEEASQMNIRPARKFPWTEKSSFRNYAICPPGAIEGNTVWDGGFTQFDAIAYFTRVVGYAHTGDIEKARLNLDSLKTTIYGTDVQGTPCTLLWDGRLLYMCADAWLDYAKEEYSSAVEKLKAAAQYDVPRRITLGPGCIWPPREQLGDIYLELGDYDKALATYQETLVQYPNRYNSLWGAGRAAELLGDKEQTTCYYQKLVNMCVALENERESLQIARRFLSSTQQ